MAWTSTTLKAYGALDVHLLKSERSKLRIAVCDAPGPIVKGTISFVTEIDNNDGLPHTLEHLVFLGSKNYPYKGFLDIISNRCFGSGTNAWTDQDHTAYTLSTLGSDGFLKVLPVYLDHLLDPLIFDAHYKTEVHHVNGAGEDGGVVYSEMQNYEGDMETMVGEKAKTVFYPPGNPYSVNTGGALKHLRESCTVQKCRDYHKKFYHVDNMLVMVTGKVDLNALKDIVEKVETKYMDRKPATFDRPFTSFVLPKLAEKKVARVQCPVDDDSSGYVEMYWYGPSPTNFKDSSAFTILETYMEDTASAPLQKEFVLTDQPLATNASFSCLIQKPCVFILRFQNVPKAKLDQVEDKALKLFRDHVQGKIDFDMERMQSIIDRKILSLQNNVENDANDMMVHPIINYQLYYETDQELDGAFHEIELLRKLRDYTPENWRDLLNEYVVSQHHATIIGVPDKGLVKKNAAEEEARLEKRKAELGEAGLAAKEKELNEAVKITKESYPPNELLDDFIVKNLTSLNRISVQAKKLLPGDDHANDFAKQFQCPAVQHTVDSNFMQAVISFDTRGISGEDKLWLMLYNSLLFESPAMINGKLHSAEEVSRLYTKDLVTYSNDPGVFGAYHRLNTLNLRVDTVRFKNLAHWAKIFTKGVQFDINKVKVIAKKLASEAQEYKRDGNMVSSAASASLSYQNGSVSATYNHIRLEKFHEMVVKLCDEKPRFVEQKLEEIRSTLAAAGANIHIIGDPERAKALPTSEWDFLPCSNSNLFEVKAGEETTQYDEQAANGLVIGVGGTESSFVRQTISSGVGWKSKEAATLLLLSQYFSQTEGPLWCRIRGNGLAYGANIYVDLDEKTISMSLYRCSDPVKAYNSTLELVREVLDSGKLDTAQFDSAKRSLIFELMDSEHGVKGAAKRSVLAQLRGLDNETSFCDEILNTSVENVFAEAGPIMKRIFTKQSLVFVTQPSKAAKIGKQLPGLRTVNVDDLALKPQKF
ncbi:unnamed protein product, partial [Mesorhabditis spiculigera]